MEITFYKYQGTGNDFVIIDNRAGEIHLPTSVIKFICDRHYGIGADGLMLLNAHPSFDFEMKYYNADGNESTMCGNGGRCLVRFAKDMDIIRDAYIFLAKDGPHQASINDNNWVRLKMKDVESIAAHNGNYVVDTGSPHYVSKVENLKEFNVYKEGNAIRNSDFFKEEGINVNFVEQLTPNSISVRTYERGVEDETLSCGTGVTAAAIAMSQSQIGSNSVEVTTLGGKLVVEFEKETNNTFHNIWLCGPATFVFKGVIDLQQPSSFN